MSEPHDFDARTAHMTDAEREDLRRQLREIEQHYMDAIARVHAEHEQRLLEENQAWWDCHNNE